MLNSKTLLRLSDCEAWIAVLKSFPVSELDQVEKDEWGPVA